MLIFLTFIAFSVFAKPVFFIEAESLFLDNSVDTKLFVGKLMSTATEFEYKVFEPPKPPIFADGHKEFRAKRSELLREQAFDYALVTAQSYNEILRKNSSFIPVGEISFGNASRACTRGLTILKVPGKAGVRNSKSKLISLNSNMLYITRLLEPYKLETPIRYMERRDKILESLKSGEKDCAVSLSMKGPSGTNKHSFEREVKKKILTEVEYLESDFPCSILVRKKSAPPLESKIISATGSLNRRLIPVNPDRLKRIIDLISDRK